MSFAYEFTRSRESAPSWYAEGVPAAAWSEDDETIIVTDAEYILVARQVAVAASSPPATTHVSTSAQARRSTRT
jgi:hypothetical protein